MSEYPRTLTKDGERTTIVAIASAPGASDRAILRLSGPRTLAIVRDVLIPNADGIPEISRNGEISRNERTESSHPRVIPGKMRWSAGDGPVRRIPCDVWLWPDEHSYTGEPCAEF
ncbi:MAG: hypothetical protein Q4C47_07555, partial [Planctomycetia bacterium]|nr:hypothetical protein [Planctomycetia bacterium]